MLKNSYFWRISLLFLKNFYFSALRGENCFKKCYFFSPLRGENCLKTCLTKKSHQNCLKLYLTFLGQKLLKKMFKNRGFLEELLKKLLNDFAASRRKLLKNPFLSNFSCLKITLLPSNGWACGFHPRLSKKRYGETQY